MPVGAVVSDDYEGCRIWDLEAFQDAHVDLEDKGRSGRGRKWTTRQLANMQHELIFDEVNGDMQK